MKIDEQLIRKVAKVSRLEVSDAQIKRFMTEFKEILEHFSVLRNADIAGLKPVFHPVEIEAKERLDKPEKCLDRKAVLALTSHQQDGYFKGPRVMQ